jgi:hypothetical protein
MLFHARGSEKTTVYYMIYIQARKINNHKGLKETQHTQIIDIKQQEGQKYLL